MFDKRVILFGSEGGARIFSSRFVEDGTDVQLCQNSNLPQAVVEVVDPILLDARIVAPETTCNCCCCPLREVPNALGRCFGGDDLALDNQGYQLFVSLGQFSIIRLERDIQLLMPAYDICMPRRDCSSSGVGGAQDPCDVFANFEFPIDQFFPPQQEYPEHGGSCGCGTEHTGSCGCVERINPCGNVKKCNSCN